MGKFFPVSFLALVGLGCGGTDGLYPVEGKVTHRGEPAAGAVVTLVPTGGAAASGVIPRGEVSAEGWFRVESGDLGPGAAPGSYAVLIEWRQGALRTHRLDAKGTVARKAARENKPLLIADDRLHGRYADVAHPRFRAEVKPEANTLSTFDLMD
jgi:hypothetical protein